MYGSWDRKMPLIRGTRCLKKGHLGAGHLSANFLCQVGSLIITITQSFKSLAAVITEIVIYP